MERAQALKDLGICEDTQGRTGHGGTKAMGTASCEWGGDWKSAEVLEQGRVTGLHQQAAEAKGTWMQMRRAD